MEAVCSLKRNEKPYVEECLICQERRSERLICGTERGLETLSQTFETRNKLPDTDNRSAINRIQAVVSSAVNVLWWHNSCFSSFTSKSKIQLLQKRANSSGPESYISPNWDATTPKGACASLDSVSRKSRIGIVTCQRQKWSS